MRKAIIAAVAAVVAFLPATLLAGSLLTAPAAHADPCAGITGPTYQACQQMVASCDGWLRSENMDPTPYGKSQWHSQYEQCQQQVQQTIGVIRAQQQQEQQRQTSKVSPPPSPTPATTPVHAPSYPPPTQAPSYPPPAQAPTTMPVQASVPPSAVVAPPKGLDASQQAIAAAKTAPATHIDPANPPAPPTHQDFNQQVQSAISAHRANIDVVHGLAFPRHWGYIDYDGYGHPFLYNPIREAMTFRYFYGGGYREVYVAAGSRVLLSTAVSGVFPFTAVGGSYLTSGSFYGGSPPAVYRNVAAYVPAYDQTVQVGSVQPVGHDDSQPAGSQDTFMLDDTTLAWGQADNPTNGGQITVTKTQTLPGVGPTDDGKSLVDLAVAVDQQPVHTWWRWLLGGGVLVIAVGLIAWMVMRRKEAVSP